MRSRAFRAETAGARSGGGAHVARVMHAGMERNRRRQAAGPDVLPRTAFSRGGLVLQGARRQRDGYVYIVDARTPTPSGKVPTADGIGAVQIEGGKPIAYHANPHYEPYGRNGLMRLDPWLEARFMEEVLELVQRRA